MLHTAWQGLLASSGVVALFISLWSFSPLAADCRTLVRKAAFGALFGAGSVVCMTAAVQLQAGVIVDLRNVLIILSAFFGGPVAAAVTVTAAVTYRIGLGGDSATAAATMMVATATFGVIARRLVQHRECRATDIFWLAAGSVVLVQVGVWLFPAVKVAPIWIVSSIAFRFAGTLLAGLAMQNEMRRQALARENTIHRAISTTLPDCLNVKDAEGRFVAANPATAALMRAKSAEALIGKSDADFYPERTASVFKAAEDEIVAAGKAHTIEQLVSHRDGSTAWLSTLKVPVFDEHGRFQGLITHNRDISDRKRLESELARTQQNFSAALDNMLDGLVMFDPHERLVFCNARYQAMFPMTCDVRKPGASMEDIMRESIRRGERGGASMDSVDAHLASFRALRGGSGAFRFGMGDGRWLEARVKNCEDGSYIVVYTDVTEVKQSHERLEAANEQLREMAQTDALTGLLNRRALDQILKAELSRVSRGLGTVSLLLIDVDWFKRFNDTYGHLAGDDCLRLVASCIKNSIGRVADRAARFGGEEFAVVLPGTSLSDAIKVAQKIRRAIHGLALPHAGSDHRTVTLSIGISDASSGSRHDMGSLVARADDALYAAKDAGRDCIKIAGEPVPAARAIA